MEAKTKELTSRGLKRLLTEELHSLREGVISPQRANATANLSRTIVMIVRTEMEAHKIKLASGKHGGELPAINMS